MAKTSAFATTSRRLRTVYPARTHKNEAALYELTPGRESRPPYHCPNAGLSAASTASAGLGI